MFAKLAQGGITQAEETEQLKRILDNDIKKDASACRKQFMEHYEALKPVFQRHWQKGLRVVFGLLSRHQIQDYLQKGQLSNSLIDFIISLDFSTNAEDKVRYFLKLSQKYPAIWTLLLVHRLSTKILHHLPVQCYTWFIAQFVRISAVIIQMYINIRNEPTKSEQDRTEQDMKVVEGCEGWVNESYLLMFSQLKSIEKESKQFKTTILCGLSEFAGALIESERQNNIKREYLDLLLEAFFKYFSSNFSLNETYECFTDSLKNNRYNNPHKKINVPEQYTALSKPNSPGSCWIIFQFLKRVGSLIFSKETLLAFYTVIYSETLATPFRLKAQILQEMIAIDGKIDEEFLERNYLLGLVLFNIYNHEKDIYVKFLEKTNFGEEHQKKIYRIVNLAKVNIENLNSDKLKFILKILDDEDIKQKEILLLVKSIEFNFINEETVALVTQLFGKAAKIHGEYMGVFEQKIAEQRKIGVNVKLCDALLETIKH